jgi:preprotein translocase SecE subunit
MNALLSYFQQSVNELALVTWPKQEELVRMTILTVVFVLISALFLGVVDYGFSNGYQWFLGLRAA